MEASGSQTYKCQTPPPREGLFYKNASIRIKSELTLDQSQKTCVLQHHLYLSSQVSHNEYIRQEYDATLDGTFTKGNGAELIAQVKGSYRIHRDQFGDFDNKFYEIDGTIFFITEGNKVTVQKLDNVNIYGVRESMTFAP